MRIHLAVVMLVSGLLFAEEVAPVNGISLRQDRNETVKDERGRSKIDIISAWGTAFGVDLSPHGFASKKLVMTVAHNIVASNQQIIEPMVKVGDEWKKTTLLYMDEILDVALLEVITEEEVPNRLMIADRDAKAGEDVALEGGTRGKPVTRRDGKVHKRFWKKQSDTIVTLPNFDHGDSGGPLINKDGKLVGIARALDRDADGEISNKCGLFIPAEAIIQFVEEYKDIRDSLDASKKKQGK